MHGPSDLSVRGCDPAGKYLCFMHADSIPPTSLVAQVHRVLADPRTVLGGFRVLVTDPAGGLMRFQTAHHYAKTYYMPAIAKPVSFFRRAPS